jgi:hypothetical protein
MIWIIIIMRLLDRLKGPFTKERCERSINYDKRTLEISGLGSDIPGIKFSLADFKTEVQKIRDASEFSELLDNYQYQMCRLCKELGKEDEEWKKYVAIRASMFNLLTSFQGTLIAFKSDPEGQKPRLYNIVGQLQDFTLLANRQILPNMEDLESKSTISKGDIQEINPNTVSKALDIAQLDETEVNQFVEDLKLVS